MGEELGPEMGHDFEIEPNAPSSEVEEITPEQKGRNWMQNAKERLSSILAPVFSSEGRDLNRFWNPATKIDGAILAGMGVKVILQNNPETAINPQYAGAWLVGMGLATIGLGVFDTISAKKHQKEIVK